MTIETSADNHHSQLHDIGNDKHAEWSMIEGSGAKQRQWRKTAMTQNSQFQIGRKEDNGNGRLYQLRNLEERPDCDRR